MILAIPLLVLLLAAAGQDGASDQPGGPIPLGTVRVVQKSSGVKLPPPAELARYFDRGRNLGRAGRGEAICVVAPEGTLTRCRSGSQDWFPINYSAEAIEVAKAARVDTRVAAPGSTVRFKLSYFVVGFADWDCALSADRKLTSCRLVAQYPVNSPDLCEPKPDRDYSPNGEDAPTGALSTSSGGVIFRELRPLPVRVRICD